MNVSIMKIEITDKHPKEKFKKLLLNLFFEQIKVIMGKIINVK